MIQGLKHQYSPEWLARWTRITTALHWVTMGLVTVAPVVLLAGVRWLLGCLAVSFVLRGAWTKASDHVDARLSAALEELEALARDCASDGPRCRSPHPTRPEVICWRSLGHDGPHVQHEMRPRAVEIELAELRAEKGEP